MDLFKLVGKIIVKNSEANDNIDETVDKAEKSESRLGRIFKGIGKVAKVSFTAITGLMVSAGVVLGKLTKSALSNYAEYEQLVGGVETLFKNSSGKLMGYANEAYKTAGMSANKYMETVTSFSASLLQSLNGDTDKAADKANQAIIDMSDNANKMGTTMESIQFAYQGFAKQNYTMLDNLKLGYGGTKEEMERLLKDAEAISGIHYDISSYADIVDAIHVIQTEMGITGTTAKEASSTIQGSIGMLKASWQNFMTGLADPKQNVGKLIDNFVDSVTTAVKNIVPKIITILPNLVNGLVKIVQQLSKHIPNLLKTLIPVIIESAKNLIQSVLKILPSLIKLLINVLPDIINAMIEIHIKIIQALPEIIQMVVKALPQLIQSIVQGLTQNLPALIQGVIQLVIGIVEALPIIIQGIVDALPQIISLIIQAILLCLPQIIQGLIQLTMAIVVALPQIIDGIIQAIPQIIDGIIQGFSPLGGKLMELAKNALDGVKDVFINIWEAIKNVVLNVMDSIKNVISNILDSIKNVFSNIWDNIKNGVSVAINGIKNIVSNVFESVRGTVTNIWNGIKDAIWTPIQWAYDKVSNLISRIKGLFNFKFQWPHIPLPHFSISGSANPLKWLTQGVPKLHVSWYAKAMDKGMIMNQPTIFGYNQATNQLMAGGEAGSETVVGTNSLMDMIKDAVQRENGSLKEILTQILDAIKQYLPEISTNMKFDLVLDSGELVGATASQMDEALGKIARKKYR